MKTLGQVLQTARQQAGWSIDALSQRSTVPAPVIHALEEEQHDQLPVAALTVGYLELLAPELALGREQLVALYRRDAQQQASRVDGRHVPSSPATRQRRRHTVLWSPRVLSLTALLTLALIAATYTTWQWVQLSQPPKLEVSEPAAYAQLSSPIIVRGHTSPGLTLTVNTEPVALDSNGNFRTELKLPPGERTLLITASDSRGRRSDVVRMITIQPE